MTVLEVQEWPDNSALIKAAFDIHVFPKKGWGMEPVVLDVTYGRGLWWKWHSYGATHQPNGFQIIDDRMWPNDHGVPYVVLIGHDIRADGVDFRHLPEPDESVDVVAFDPDYIAPGGRETTTVPDFFDRYGLKAEYESPAALQAMNDEGLTECARVLRPQGILLVKTATYISSGKPWLGEYHTIHHALGLGLKVEDIFVHVSGTGPQPKRETRQKHARSNSSRLIVLRKPGRRKTT